MAWKILSLWLFGILSTICFLTECYEIVSGDNVYWSDHLHNLLDHAMFVVINYIGFKVARSQ